MAQHCPDRNLANFPCIEYDSTQKCTDWYKNFESNKKDCGWQDDYSDAKYTSATYNTVKCDKNAVEATIPLYG